MATELWRCEDRHVLVSVHTRSAPTDAEWDEFLAAGKKALDELNGRAGLCGFSLSDGGAPTTHQRKAMNRLLPAGDVPVAIITDSAIVRSVVTALSWFNRGIRAFPPAEAASALRYLTVAKAKQAELFSVLEKLQSRLPEVRVLRSLRLGDFCITNPARRA